MSTVVTLVTGDDPVLVAEATGAVVDELVGDGDRTLMVGEVVVDKPDGGEVDLGPVLDAATTLPFLTDRRVVVVRSLSWADTKGLAPLLALLEDPVPTTSLVLVWDKQPGQQRLSVPKALKEAVAAAGGEVRDTKPGTGKARTAWIDEHLADAGVELDAAARRLLVDRLGEDVARLGGVLATLETAYGEGARLGAEEVEPFCGEAGGVPPWDLTDAIDDGRRTEAIDLLHRMLAGDRHPLAVLSTLHTHYGRMLRLDGADVRDEKEAASALGMKGSSYPAKKAMNQGRRLGPANVQRAVLLLADADLDLRGRRAWPDVLVLEVLVARLAFLSRR